MRKLFWSFGTLFMVLMLQAQVEIPGSIMGDYRQMKGTDLIYLLPPPNQLEEDAVLLQNSGPFLEKSHHYAMLRSVGLLPEYNGSWEQTATHRIWRVHLISPGAVSLGLVFNSFRLEEGVQMMVYSPDRHYVKGAYSSLNNKSSGIFAVGHIPGEELIVELQVPNETGHYGEFSLSALSHAFYNCTGFGCSGQCEIDMACVEGINWREERRAVVRVNTPTQYCSGVLINNTSYNGDPLLLTAKHCMEDPEDADGTVFEFMYESPDCFGGDGSLSRSISGAEVLATGDSVDFCLLRLSLDPPAEYEPYYAGWDLAEQQYGATTTIHHPWGDVKKISHDFQSPETPSSIEDIYYQDWRKYYYYSFWWILQWDVGTTEPGSSGSPLFNQDKQVIGLLSWGSASCGDSIGYDSGTDRVIYDNEYNINDFYTKLNVAWDAESDPAQSLYQWLDPGQTGAMSLGPYDPLSIIPASMDPAHHFRIFPNPSEGLVRLDPVTREPLAYVLYDLGGRIRMQGKLVGGILEMDHGLGPGIYILSLDAAAGREHHKIILE